MKENFRQSLLHVLKHEGGYVNHPRDPGGATNKGVIQRTYNGYLRRKGRTLQSVRFITDGEVADIYKTQYWDAVSGDELPSGVDYCIFDGAVNSGPSRSIKWLQRAIGAGADGVIGNETLGKILTVAPKTIINRVCDDRLGFMQRIKDKKGRRAWLTFGRGWSRRVKGVRTTSLEWADEVPAPEPQPVDVSDAVPKPPVNPTNTTAGVAVAVGVGAAAEQVAPGWGFWAGLGVGVALMAVLAVVIFVLNRRGS